MRTLPRLLARSIAALLIFTLTSQAALAQSILRDAETEALLHDLATPLVNAAGMDPRNVDVVLVGDRSINAFVAGGQIVYINEGLIETADSAAEVQAVIAHELGHITGGHAINDGGSKAATGISLLSLILGGIGRCRDGRDHGRTAGRNGQIFRVQPRTGGQRRCCGRDVPVESRHLRARLD